MITPTYLTVGVISLFFGFFFCHFFGYFFCYFFCALSIKLALVCSLNKCFTD